MPAKNETKGKRGTSQAAGPSSVPVADCVVLYARISKDRDDESSTASQLRRMRAHCEAQGWTVVGEFVDLGKSAFKIETKRPQLDAAFRMIENGFATRLVVWKLDRLTRNARGFLDILKRLDKAGAVFASVMEPYLDTSSGFGLAITMLFTAMAEMEAENARTRIVPWHADRKTNGAVPNGPRPYGYERSRNALTVNEDEAKVLREIASRVLAGDSLREITRDLNDRGIPFGYDSEGNAKPWNHTGVKRTVTNATSAAMRRMSDGTLNPSDQWTAILDAATYAKVCAILNDPARRTSTEDQNEWRSLLAGLLTCGKCGKHAFSAKFQYDSKSGGKHAHRRYQCRECWNSIDMAQLDAFVSEQLLALLDDEAWNDMRSRGRKSDPFAMDRMRAFLSGERAKALAGTISQEEWEDTQREAHAAMAALEEAEAVEIPDVDSIRAAWPELDHGDRQLVISAVFSAITILPYRSGTTGTKRIELDIAA